jgi:hypothetical protein
VRLARFAVLTALAAACSNASYGEDPRDGGSDAGTTSMDAALADSAPSAADAISDAEAPLVPNGGFEDPGGACGATWELVNASAVKATPARTGASACKVCNVSNESYFGLRVEPEPRARAGGWTFEAYYRAVPDAVSAPEAHPAFAWKSSAPDGGGSENPIAQMPADYAPVQIVKQLGDDAVGDLEIRVAAAGPSGSCFLVDDVTLTVVPR